MTFAKLRILWPSITALAMAGLVVARSAGYFRDLDDDQAQNLLMFLGTALTGLAVKSGYDDTTNAATIATVSAVAATQATTLKLAGDAVVSAAFSQPTTETVEAAVNTAKMVNSVISETEALIGRIK